MTSADMAAEPQAIEEKLPDPPKEGVAGGGIGGALRNSLNVIKAVTGNVVRKVSENETVAKGWNKTKEVSGKAWEGTKNVAGRTSEKTKETWGKMNENEKFKGAVDGTKNVAGKSWDKTKEVSSNTWEGTKRVSGKVVDKSKEFGGKIAEKSQPLVDKTKEIGGKIGEKAAPIVGKTKEIYGGTKKKAGDIWAAGGGVIHKVKNELTEGGWRGNAKETLLRREEANKKWGALRIRGAEELDVAARKEYTTNYFVEKGTLLRWSFRVKDFDIGFGVRIRVMEDGGSREEDILPVEKFDNTDTIEGSWTADEDRTIVLVFDNKSSILRGKTIAYLVGVEPPQKLEEIAEVAAEEGEANTIAATEADPATDSSAPAAAPAASMEGSAIPQAYQTDQ